MTAGVAMKPGASPTNLPSPHQTDYRENYVKMSSSSTPRRLDSENPEELLAPETANNDQVQSTSRTIAEPKPENVTPPLVVDDAQRQEYVKLIRQQLILLLHAHNCQMRDRQVHGGSWRCSLPPCKNIKEVLTHLSTCEKGKECTRPHCGSSRQILVHWNQCHNSDCSICLPLRKPYKKTTLNFYDGMQGPSGIAATGRKIAYPPDLMRASQWVLNLGQPISSNPIGPVSSSSVVEAVNTHFNNEVSPIIENQPLNLKVQTTPVQEIKEWPQSSTAEARKINVNNLIHAIFTTDDSQPVFDNRLKHLVDYATKVEEDIYHTAKSEFEYNQLLLDKVISSRIEIEDRRRKRETEAQLSLTQLLALREQLIPSNANHPTPPIGTTVTAGGSENPEQEAIDIQLANLNNLEQPGTSNGNQMPNIQLTLEELVKPTPAQVIKEWHQELVPNLRSHLIFKIVEVIFPCANGLIFDNRIKILYAFAKKIELDTYESADSKTKYMHLLAEKIYQTRIGVQKICHESEQLPLAQQQQHQQPTVGNLGVGTSALAPNVPAAMSPQRATSSFPNPLTALSPLQLMERLSMHQTDGFGNNFQP